MQLADAGPQDEQGNERRGRQIAAEGNERFKEGFNWLVGSHGDTQRKRDGGSKDESCQYPPDGHADILGETVFGKKQPAFMQHGCRAGEKGRGNETEAGNGTPESNENDKE